MDVHAQPHPLSDDVPAPLHVTPFDTTTITVSGEVDLYSAPDLTAALEHPAVNRVILTGVTFIDAAGLAVLLTAHHRRPHGLTLCSPSRHVLRLLDLTGHRSTFPCATREATTKAARPTT
jgi:anti-anti-sigma factor